MADVILYPSTYRFDNGTARLSPSDHFFVNSNHPLVVDGLFSVDCLKQGDGNANDLWKISAGTSFEPQTFAEVLGGIVSQSFILLRHG